MGQDSAHMAAALTLARRGLGSAWPNPAVGAVVVKDGRVVGRGCTAPGGRPHAETVALDMAGPAAKGATLYVTLEPCCHWGRTPPCTDAIIAAGIARVVLAIRDPDPRMNGRSVALLRQAGIGVEEGVGANEATDVAAGFLARLRLGRPLITLKLASTLDGRIATRTGESQWISSEAARRVAHGLRGRHDAVMVGAGTVAADNPDLTCRIPGYARLPTVRVVADTHLRTSLLARIVATARTAPTWLICGEDADADRRAAFQGAGVTVIPVPRAEPGIALEPALQALAERGLTRVLVEGGAALAAALLRADLVDRIAWFHAPAVMGGDGRAAVLPFGVASLAAMPTFRRNNVQAAGSDLMTELERNRC
jgi:diaminohydroxyphosphoribosylaminopyrimidine deaminase/5-amino-6-(5-phosphoribosylamino)uracil reductase